MKQILLSGLSAILVLIVSPTLRAADCVNLDLELTPEVLAGSVGQGSFELTNCGDLAGTIVLTVALQIPDGPTIEIADIPVQLGAGETIIRNFTYPAPWILTGHTFGLCVTAQMGEASAHDCASTTIVHDSNGDDGGRENFGVALSFGNDCIETDLELTDVIYTSPGDFMAEAFFELTNCGDDEADVNLDIEIEGYRLSTSSAPPIHVGAGETVSRQWAFAVPPFIPSGDYNICVTATAGTAVATDCEMVKVLSTPPISGSDVAVSDVSNFPNPFNPTTQISFNLNNDSRVSVEVVNLLGRRVRVLADAVPMKAGSQQLEWNGRDDSGQPVSSGIYFYRIFADDQAFSEKMVLVK